MARVLEQEVNLSRRACWNISKKIIDNKNDDSLVIKSCRINHNECYVRTKLILFVHMKLMLPF